MPQIDNFKSTNNDSTAPSNESSKKICSVPLSSTMYAKKLSQIAKNIYRAKQRTGGNSGLMFERRLKSQNRQRAPMMIVSRHSLKNLCLANHGSCKNLLAKEIVEGDVPPVFTRSKYNAPQARVANNRRNSI
mmetsp:Transcript_11464/g.13020  ORF Transcript_11464/g.13020 Transcript_11464/m.13020 type:complete len:132 (-) Transcript_11464:72-467(-)